MGRVWFVEFDLSGIWRCSGGVYASLSYLLLPCCGMQRGRQLCIALTCKRWVTSPTGWRCASFIEIASASFCLPLIDLYIFSQKAMLEAVAQGPGRAAGISRHVLA